MFCLTDGDSFELSSENKNFLLIYKEMKDKVYKYNINKEIKALRSKVIIKSLDGKDCSKEEALLRMYEGKLATGSSYEVVNQ